MIWAAWGLNYPRTGGMARMSKITKGIVFAVNLFGNLSCVVGLYFTVATFYGWNGIASASQSSARPMLLSATGHPAIWAVLFVVIGLALAVPTWAIFFRSLGVTPSRAQSQVNPQGDVTNPTGHVNIEDFYRTYDNVLLKEWEQNVRTQSSKFAPGADRENFLTRLLATLITLGIFEITWLQIFGSQLRAIRKLNSRMLTLEELRHYYDEGSTAFPNLYENRPFEVWLAFLRNWILLRENGDKMEITIRGREFLKYLDHNGYDETVRVG